jgi:hypothetical protein
LEHSVSLGWQTRCASAGKIVHVMKTAMPIEARNVAGCIESSLALESIRHREVFGSNSQAGQMARDVISDE